MWQLGLFILASSGVVSFTAWKIAEQARQPTFPPFEPIVEPPRRVEPNPQPVTEPELPERRIDNDPVPVGGHTPRIRRL